MSDKWATYKFEDAPIQIIDGDRGVNYPKQSDFLEVGHCLFLNTGNVTKVGFNFNSCSFISSEKDAQLRKGKLQRNDSVLTTRGTVGNVALYDSSVPYEDIRINSGMVILRPERQALLPRFLYFFLKSALFEEQMRSLTTGSAQPQFPIRDIKRLSISIPSPNEQVQIVDILGSLDDKIELNRRMNQTLESIARAIFKSWFVDFDPVRAKANGQQPPGLSTEIAALFSDSFEDTEPVIPTGWTMGKLGDVATHPRRTVNPGDSPPGTPYIGLEHMPRQSIALSEWGVSDDVASNKFAFKKGEILFGKLRPYFHKVGPPVIDGVCSTDIVVVAPKKPCWFSYVLAVVSSTDFVNHTTACSTGTRMPRTNWKDMASYEIAVPPEPVAKAFHGIIEPFVEKIHPNILESKTLAEIRDTLLPKLLSGEIRVSNLNGRGAA